MKPFEKIFLCFLTIVFCEITSSAQCPQDNIFLETQAQIDSFLVLYPNCTEIDSSLYIGTFCTAENSYITNLNSLNQINSIGGDLRITTNMILEDLTGLENLTSVGKDLQISSNSSLVSLSGLDNLSSIGGTLKITGNDILIGLEPLSNVTSFGDNLWVGGNDRIVNLNGLENLTSNKNQS